MWAFVAAVMLAASPNDVMSAAVLDLEQLPAAVRPHVRYLSAWPAATPEDVERVESVLLFWSASLNQRRITPTIGKADGGLYRFVLPEWGWKPEAWEALGSTDPYFAGDWIDPVVSGALTKSTGSKYPVMRADWFIARTSLDGKSGFFRGYYSLFLGLPDTEQQLFKDLLLPVEQERFNFLLRGGAVLQSEVAQNNRELQLMPSFFGSEQAKYFWKSFDTDADTGDKSVLEKFRGEITVAGGEHIWSLQNGLQGYFIIDAQGKRLAEVPTNVAQDKHHQFDGTVRNPYSCVVCHSQGINHFDDVVSRMMLAKDTGLIVYDKDPIKAAKQKELLEEYYLSELGKTIATHQVAYATAVNRINGLSPADNASRYKEVCDGYLFRRVDSAVAAAECGCTPAELLAACKRSGDSSALALAADIAISREKFEAAYKRVMHARVYPWQKLQHEEPNDEFKIPPGSQFLLSLPDDPPGSVRFRLGGTVFFKTAAGAVYRRDGDRWTEIPR